MSWKIPRTDQGIGYKTVEAIALSCRRVHEKRTQTAECRLIATVGVGASLLCGYIALVPAVARADQPQTVDSLQEVVVTATKRNESMLQVPSSITALSSNFLQSQGVQNFSDYMALVPGLEQNSGGVEGHGLIIMRGLNTGIFQTTNTVAYYVDDAPLSANSSGGLANFANPDFDLGDIDHIEVLKGPQSTLYGASALGGLIKVVLKQPDLHADSGQVKFGGSSVQGGGNGFEVSGIGNMVLVPGKLALRVDGFDRDLPGYMTNVELGTKDEGGYRSQGGRVALRWEPTDNLEIRLSAYLQHNAASGWNYEYVNQDTLQPIAGQYTYSSLFDPQFRTTYRLYAATINYKLGSIGTLTDSASYYEFSDYEISDWTPWLGPDYNFFAPAPLPANYALEVNDSPSMGKVNNELRFTSRRIGRFEDTAGFYYTSEHINGYTPLVNIDPQTLQALPPPNGNLYYVDNYFAYQEEALYDNVTYYMTDALSATLGGRYSHNRQTLNSCQSGFAAAIFAYIGCEPQRTSDSDFTWLAAVRWQVSQDLSTYARVATAYRPGGMQILPTNSLGIPPYFKPDTVTNYEVGLKGEWLDHRLRSTVALYDMEWKDIQLQAQVAGLAGTENGGNARVQGVEFDSQLIPIEHLELGATLAYTDPRLLSVLPGVTAGTGAVAGDHLPYTPTWAGSATADYVQPLGSVALNYGATFTYQGKKLSGYPDSPLDTGVMLPHYETVGLHAGLDWDRYTVQLHVDNLLNEHAYTTLQQERIDPYADLPAWAGVIQPRTYKLSVTVRF